MTNLMQTEPMTHEMTQSERVAVSLAAIRTHEAKPLAEKFAIIDRALKERSVFAALGVVLAGAVACGAPTPPTHYSFEEGFSETEQETLHATVDAWCESGAKWCPRFSLWSEDGRFILVDDLPEKKRVTRACPEGHVCEVAGNERDGRVRIARNRREPENMAILWRVAAHEIGHLCIEGHPVEGGMMAAYQPPEAPLEVDAEAVRAWAEGCF